MFAGRNWASCVDMDAAEDAARRWGGCVLVGAAAVQLARRAGAPPAPARRPPLGLPRIVRLDRLSSAVPGRPRAASRRGAGDAAVPAACGEILAVAVRGGLVGLRHPDPLAALSPLRGVPRARRRPAPSGIPIPSPRSALSAACPPSGIPIPRRIPRPFHPGLQRRAPPAHRSRLPALFAHAAAQEQALGDGRRELFAHDQKVCRGTILESNTVPIRPGGTCDGANAGPAPSGICPTWSCHDAPHVGEGCVWVGVWVGGRGPVHSPGRTCTTTQLRLNLNHGRAVRGRGR